MTHRAPRLLLVVLAASATSLSMVTVASAARVPVPTALVTAAVRLPAGATALGPEAASTNVSFDVYLQSRDAAALTAYAAAVTKKNSVTYGHYLARGAFEARYGASPSAIAAMRRALHTAGLSVRGSVIDGIGLTVSGRVSDVDSFFDTSLERYRLADGHVGVASTRGLSLPVTLSSSVLGVIGLDNLVAPTTSLKRPAAQLRPLSHIRWPESSHAGSSFTTQSNTSPGAPAACPLATTATEQGVGGITDAQVAQAYGVDSLYSGGDLGAGQTVAIFELEPFEMSDIAGFDQCYFGASHTGNVSVTNVDGGPGSGYGSGESDLDIENVSALAPAAAIDVYQASDTEQGSTDAYGQIVANDTARIVSTSWGACEAAMLSEAPGTLNVEHLLFEQAAAQGQTIFASAGDDGADDCAGHDTEPVSPDLSVDDPASQPYVVSVGGTTALTVTDPPTEQVWNDGAEGGAGGGGISSLWPMPSWQRDVPAVTAHSTSTCGTGTTLCRVTPDVTGFADEYTGITIEIEGGWFTIGGTSSSAPMWAALLAEVNESPACQSHEVTAHGVGFASPLLYEVGADPTQDAQSFNDVATGNNDIFSIENGNYAATTGYDLASGWGSPDLWGTSDNGLAANLCDAAAEQTTSGVTSVRPTAGTTAGGTSVTITGTGFMSGATVDVAGVSFGDYPAANFAVDSATQITATTAPAGVAKLFGKAVTAGNEGLVEVTYTSGHVATGPTFSFVKTSGTSLRPVVDSVGPTGGPTAGGNTVDVYGTGFTGATSVHFGGVVASNVVVHSDDELSATAPARGSAKCLAVSDTAKSKLCQTTVTVTTPAGTSAVVSPLKPLQGFLSYNDEGVPFAPAKCDCEIYTTPTEYDFQGTPGFATLVNLDASKQMPDVSPEYGSQYAIEGSGYNWLTLNYVSFGAASQEANQDVDIASVTYTGIELFGLSDSNPQSTAHNVAVRVNSQGGFSRAQKTLFGPVPRLAALGASWITSAGGRRSICSDRDSAPPRTWSSSRTSTYRARSCSPTSR